MRSVRPCSPPDALSSRRASARLRSALAQGKLTLMGSTNGKGVYAAKAYEAGLQQRVVIIEFPSVDAAAAAHDGAGYQAALKVFDNAAKRDLRIVEGLE